MTRKKSLPSRFDHHRLMVSSRYIIPTIRACAEAHRINAMSPADFDEYCREMAEAESAKNQVVEKQTEDAKWFGDYCRRPMGRRPQAPYKK